jgi:hypothetical protein
MSQATFATDTTPATRRIIAEQVIAKLGARRAAQGLQEPHPPENPKYGFEGVDIPRKPTGNRPPKYRARIRFCDALEGGDVRISQCGFDTPEEAGVWVGLAHVLAWGALSRYADEYDLELLAKLIQAEQSA